MAWSFTAEEVQQRRQRLLSRLAPDALSADIAARIHAIPTASLAWNAPLSGAFPLLLLFLSRGVSASHLVRPEVGRASGCRA